MTNPQQHLELIEDAALARQMRAETEQQQTQIRQQVAQVAMPLWERIRRRRQVNGFGEDYDLTLTPRKA